MNAFLTRAGRRDEDQRKNQLLRSCLIVFLIIGYHCSLLLGPHNLRVAVEIVFLYSPSGNWDLSLCPLTSNCRSGRSTSWLAAVWWDQWRRAHWCRFNPFYSLVYMLLRNIEHNIRLIWKLTKCNFIQAWQEYHNNTCIPTNKRR